MPALTISTYSSLSALKPTPSGESITLATMTEPSNPALCAIWRTGSSTARLTRLIPVCTSPSSLNSSNTGRISIKVVPPPATIPSSTAARVAFKASSKRSFLSFNSTSVAAPTSITATPPDILAKRSCNFSLSKSDVVSAICALICATRSLIAAASPWPSTIVVSSFVTRTWRAVPRSSMPMLSNLRPTSSVITVAPVKVAISCNIALRRSPNPGAFTATALNVPRNLLTTRVAKASPSTSSAIIRSSLPACTTFSKVGNISWMDAILRSVTIIYGSDITASILSGSVTMYGEIYPRSNCIPSTTDNCVPIVFDSSTVITPSLPTFSIASAIKPPTSSSPAEMEATCAMASLSLTSIARFWISSTKRLTAFSTPRFKIIGLAPAATLRMPSWIIACANKVAVVVPSPATSFVFVATSFTSCAPMFSKGSSNSISRAIVTPSFVMVGAPNFLSNTTLRPLGPNVTFTAFANASTPLPSARRASSLNKICFAIMSHSL